MELSMTINGWGAMLMTGTLFVSAVVALMGVALGGFLVLRARGNGYEPIIPPLRDKETTAVNLDDYAQESFSMEDVDKEIEKIFKQRAEEDPILKASQRMREQEK